MSEPIDPRLLERERQLAQYRDKPAREPDKLGTLLVMHEPAERPAAPAKPRLAPPPRIAPARDDAEHERQWRANLQRYAPIAKWEQAWFANPRDPNWPATLEVAAWLEGGCKKHLVLTGAMGAGKSVAAAYAVKRWVEPGANMVPVTWLEADDVVSAVMHAYDEKSPRLHKHVVVDDMGFETRPEFGYALRKLLDRQVTLLITTNLTKRNRDPAKTFSGRYAHEPRLLSQMFDLCTTRVVAGGDRRSKDGWL